MSSPINVAVFASGGGSNFQSIIDKTDAGDLPVRLALLAGNNSNAGAFERARAHHIPTLHIAPSHFTDDIAYAEKLLFELESRAIDLIVLAGYMKMIPTPVVRAYHHRIINIHPALLPAFGGTGMYGTRVHQAVLDYGAKVSGITIHFVDEEYDHGPVILQETVSVMDSDTADTLARRVLQLEHAHYWRAVRAFAQKTIRVEGRKVIGTV